MNTKKRFENIKCINFSILKRREELNFKQTQLGTDISLSQKQYSRVESGEVKLKLQVFLQIAHALNVNPCDLLTKSGILKGFPDCEKTVTIFQLNEQMNELIRRNTFLETILNKLPESLKV